MAKEILQHKKVIVLGYGRSGKSAINALLSLGADILLTTNEVIPDDKVRQTLLGLGVEIVDGHHPASILNDADLIVKNPGISYRIPFLEEAVHRNVPIITEVELSYHISEAPIIGITGTNGKTTVTHLIGEMLERAGRKPVLCGNIGYPATRAAMEATSDNVLVMELSSFQLMGVYDFRPDVAVYTNIYEAHLDYHASKEEYVQAKLALLAKMTEDDTLVFNGDQEELISHLNITGPVEYFSASGGADASIEDGVLTLKADGLIHVDDILLKGSHNHENILAAVLAVSGFDVPREAVIDTLKTFGGIPHRMEYLGTLNGVRVYNDSKATNNLATSFALKSFKNPVIWLAGGLDRGQSLDELIPHMERVKHIITFGETEDKFKALGDKTGIAVTGTDSPYSAVRLAAKQAKETEVILFSPACASWDQYKDYEARGNHFKEGFFSLTT